jgi:hypothetical protein
LGKNIFFIPTYAGKTAFLWVAVILPIVVLLFLQVSKSFHWIVFSVCMMVGLIMVHYTAVHLMAALLGAIVFIGRLTGSMHFSQGWRIGVAGVVAVCLFALMMPEAFGDYRTVDQAPTHLFEAMREYWNLVWAKSSPLQFGRSRFGTFVSIPYETAIVTITALIVSIVSYRTQYKQFSILTFSLILTYHFLILCGVEVLPLKMNLDFARHTMWPVLASVLVCIAYGAVLFLRTRSHTIIQVTGAFLCGIVLACLSYLDSYEYFLHNLRVKVSRAQLHHMQDTIGFHAPDGQPCYVVGAGRQAFDAGVALTVQASRTLDYVEIITGCVLVDGAWVHTGIEGGRTIAGRPDIDLLERLQAGGRVFIVGPPQTNEQYFRALGLGPAELGLVRIGSLEVLEVWADEQ